MPAIGIYLLLSFSYLSRHPYVCSRIPFHIREKYDALLRYMPVFILQHVFLTTKISIASTQKFFATSRKRVASTQRLFMTSRKRFTRKQYTLLPANLRRKKRGCKLQPLFYFVILTAGFYLMPSFDLIALGSASL